MERSLIYNIEDDESIRELVRYALESAGYEVVSFERAEEMLSAFESRVPDLVVLDIMLPGIDGMTALKKIKTGYPEVKVIMLTAKTAEINKVQGLDSGADDYMSKPFSVLELQARVRAHLRSTAKATSEKIIEAGNIKIDALSRSVTVNDEEVSLTYKEFELLNYLAQNIGTAISRDTLLKEIWGFDFVGESRTVDIHIKNLRNKLGSSGERILSVRGIGYTLKQHG